MLLLKRKQMKPMKHNCKPVQNGFVNEEDPMLQILFKIF